MRASRDAGLGEHDPCWQKVRGHVVVKCRSSASREIGVEIMERSGTGAREVEVCVD